MTNVLDREEYIEQGYFFRVLRERIAENVPAQQILVQVQQEVLSTTRLAMAIGFLADELKHTGELSSGALKLPHYFTPFQALVLRKTEEDKVRFSIEIALLILEREAQYRAGTPTSAGLFVYQFEAMARNRLGYNEGLGLLQADAQYDADWRAYLEMVRTQVGIIDFADLIYVRSELYVKDQRRRNPDYEPSFPPLFGEKEGKIARANRGRDPLYLFAALQRQLGYPEVPRTRAKDDPAAKLEVLRTKVQMLESRLKLLEGEIKGKVDLSEFLAKPDLLNRPNDEE